MSDATGVDATEILLERRKLSVEDEREVMRWARHLDSVRLLIDSEQRDHVGACLGCNATDQEAHGATCAVQAARAKVAGAPLSAEQAVLLDEVLEHAPGQNREDIERLLRWTYALKEVRTLLEATPLAGEFCEECASAIQQPHARRCRVIEAWRCLKLPQLQEEWDRAHEVALRARVVIGEAWTTLADSISSATGRVG